MKTTRLGALLFVVTLFIVTVSAGEPNVRSTTCGGKHLPDDRITCYVKFAKKTHFKDLQVVFNLPREDKPRTRGSYINFILRDTKQIGPRLYSVSGVPGDCVPGTYILAAVTARTESSYQQYSNLSGPTIVVGDDSEAISPVAAKRSNPAPETQPLSVPSWRVVETPPSDPSLFPAVTGITPVAVTPTPMADLVSVFSRFLRKSSSCSGTHNQGDTVRCRVQFAGRSQFQTVAMSFYRDEPRTSFYQSQQCLGFGVGTKNSPLPHTDAFEVWDPIPKCRAGRYRIATVTAFAYSMEDAHVIYVKTYVNGTDFKSKMTLKVKDISQRDFPAVVAVGDDDVR